jgi:hypothetical protein
MDGLVRLLDSILTYLSLFSNRYFAHWFIYLTLLSAELNPIFHLLALLGAHSIFHISGLRVN